MATTEHVLWERWLRGRDAEAFRTLAERHAAMVYGTCLRILGNASEAEDVSQECFEALAGLGRAPKTGLVGAWLHGVATKRALHHMRSARNRRRRETQFAASQDGHTEPTWHDIHGFVDEAIAQLPEKLRTPLVQRFLESRSANEIAQDLGVSRQTVTYRTGRAIEAVRKHLARRGVAIAAPTLAALLTANIAEAAASVPATLTAALGRIAVSGAAAAGAGAGFAVGLSALKVAGVAVVIILAALAGLWAVTQGSPGTQPVGGDAAALSPIEDGTSDGAPKETADSPPPRATDMTPPSTHTASHAGLIEGRVYDAETDAGIANVEIRAYGKGPARLPCGEDAPAAVTDDTGSYTLEAPLPGRYSVRLPHDRPPGPYVRTEVRKVVLEEGEAVAGVDFALAQGYRIAGMVVGTEGAPLAAVNVSGHSELNTGGFAAETDETGAFEGHVRPPALGLTVVARRPGGDAEPRLDSFRHGPYDVPPEGLEGLVIPAYPHSRITGRLLSAQGRPEPGVDVLAKFETHDAIGDTVQAQHRDAVGKPDRGGRFEMDIAHPGEYRLYVLEETYEEAVLASVTLAPGETVAGLELRIPQGVTPRRESVREEEPFRIVGMVLDTTDRPIANASVRATGYEELRTVSSGYGLTDDAGRFDFGARRDMAHWLQISHNDYSRATMKDVRPGTPTRVVLERRNAVELQVVRAVTGEPVQAYQAKLHSPGLREYRRPSGLEKFRTSWTPALWAQAFTGIPIHRDTTGRQRFEDRELGPTLLIVRAPGLAPGFAFVDVPRVEEGPAEIRLELQEGLPPVTGRVTDIQGRPVPHTAVGLTDDEPAFGIRDARSAYGAAPTRTDEEGRFELEVSLGGKTAIWAYHPDYAPAVVELDTRRAPFLKFTLEGCGRLEGHVTIDGVPAGDVGVSTELSPHVRGELVKTSRDGRYVIERVAPGAVSVMVRVSRATRTQKLRREAVIETGETTVVDLDVPPVTSGLEGEVTIDGEPALGIDVTLTVDGPGGEDHEHEGYGPARYRVVDLPAGHVVMTVKATMDMHIPDWHETTVELDLMEGEVLTKDIRL